MGDSFTYGDELADINDAWPYLVAGKLSVAVDNKGIPAGGNTQIVRSVIDNICSNAPADLVLIGWTSPGRVEFADEAGVFDTWPGYNGAKFKLHEPWRETIVEYINRHHEPEYLYKQYLINIITVQTYLKYHNIKYLMLLTVANEYYKNTFRDQFAELRGQIDPTYFVDPGLGMAEWTRGVKKGDRGHFLEDGHRIVANKVLDKIKQLGWA